jgi:hypothetical protein
MRAGEVFYRTHAAGPHPDLTNDLRSPASNLVNLAIHAHKKTTRSKR